VDEHLHVDVPFLFEDVEAVYAYFGEGLPDFDDGLLVVGLLGVVQEVRLPLLDPGGVDLVALLVLHVVVFV